MSDSDNLESRVAVLSEKIRSLEEKANAPKSPWYADWREVLKAVGLPIALIISCFAFYDKVILRASKEDAAAAERASVSLRELTELNAKTFQLNATGREAESFAILEAGAARRERLVDTVYNYWVKNSEYFTTSETTLLANELLSAGQSDRALEVAKTLNGVNKGPIGEADQELFLARILFQSGPANDSDAARPHAKKAIEHAGKLSGDQRSSLYAKIAATWLFYEQSNGNRCDEVKLPAEIAQAIWDENPEFFDVLKRMAQKGLAQYEAECLSL